MPTKTYLKLLKSCCCALFLFFTIYASSQNTTAHKDSIHFYDYKTLDSLARENYYPNPALSKQYAEISLRKAQLDQNDERIANALVRIAMMEAKFDRFENAHHLIDSAITIVKEKIHDKNKEHSYLFFKGNLYLEIGNYIEALKYFKTVQKFKRSIGDATYERDLNHNIAIIKNEIGKPKEAILLLKENYNFFKEKDKTNFHPTLYLSTIIILNSSYITAAELETNPLLKEQYIDSATYYNKIGFEKSSFYDKRGAYNQFVYEKAAILYLQKNYTESIKYYKEALEKAKEIPQNLLITTSYLAIGKNYEKLKDYENAIAYFKKLDSIYIPNGVTPFIKSSIYSSLSDIYIQKKDTLAATKYLNLLIESKEKTSSIKYAIWAKLHELHDIPLLEDKIKAISKDVDRKQNYLSSSIIFIVILIFLFITVVYYQRNKRKQNKVKFDNLLKELETKKQVIPIKKSKSPLTIDEEKVQQILVELNKFEKKKQFLESNCDLAFVAKKVKTNKAYLSKVIHA
ncbi:tetratricopeptide repeat protein, partial [Kordia jejudonensis]|uniref:tetratricopeptide repeat protein n=1 Tax=Kordia jejudonensis TaxID=1348245 RepID=UPI0006296B08